MGKRLAIALRSRFADDPVRHASAEKAPLKAGLTGKSLCGAFVFEKGALEFNPDHPRACPKCAAAVRRMEDASPMAS